MAEVKIIKDVLPIFDFNYLKGLVKAEHNKWDYNDFFGRYYASHDDLKQIQPIVTKSVKKASEIFESETLKFTYALLTHYEGHEAKLLPHTDDNACTYTLDICLYQNTSWPIIVEGKEYYLNENEGLAFYGEVQEHWRPAFPDPDNNEVAMCFIHYAEPDHWFFKGRK